MCNVKNNGVNLLKPPNIPSCSHDENALQLDLKNRVSLGILTKTSSTPVVTRLARYALQERSAELLPKERVRKCLRNRIDKYKPVDVMYNEKREKAHYSNVQRCGSIWSCPVCASIISENRKLEVRTALDKHLDTGGGVYMITLTIPHYKGDNLKGMLKGLRKATGKYFGGTRQMREAWLSIGKVGHIKALEVTYGDNGWHPHYHIIVFTSKKLTGASLTPFVEGWQNCCKLAKLPIPSRDHGVDFRGGNRAVGDYLNKWGLEHEVTKSHTKQGKEGSLTPWDMLKQSMVEGVLPEYTDKMSRLFQEFAISFKGCRQLSWSKGLKDLYGINDKTDEELSEETEKEAVEVMQLDLMRWSLIKRYQRRADLLQCVEYDQKFGTEFSKDLFRLVASYELSRLQKEIDNSSVAVSLEPKNNRNLWYGDGVEDLDKPDWVLG